MPDIERYTPSQMENEIQNLAIDYVSAVGEVEEDNGYFEDISDAIVAKDGGQPPEKEDMADRILAIPSPVIPVEEKDVNFYDYDGTLLYTYTKSEFLALESFPTAPTHDGLTSRGWNWSTLQAVKDYVTDYGICDIGATYITDDGSTRLYLSNVAESDLSDWKLYVKIKNGTLTVSVNGSVVATETESSNSEVNHTIAFSLPTAASYPADYKVALSFSGSGYYSIGQGARDVSVFGWDSEKKNKLDCVEIGNVNKIENYAFYCYNSLKCVVITTGISSGLGSYSFMECSLLKCIVLPNGVAVSQNAFQKCVSLETAIINSDVSVTMLSNCNSLKRLIIPNNVSSLTNNMLNGCSSLLVVVIPDTTTYIIGGAFQECSSLNRIAIPHSIISFGAYAFYRCYLLFVLDLSAYTDPQNIPTLANANVLSNTPSTQIIYVANQSMLDAFSAATNWSTYADRFQIKGV